MKFSIISMLMLSVFAVCISAQELKLVDGRTPREGRLMLFHDDVWGTVSHKNFRGEEVTVVCNSLGFSNDGVRVVAASKGAGADEDPIWLNNVVCVGTESLLGDCGHDGWGVTTLTHSADVWVQCRDSALVTYLVTDSGTGIADMYMHATSRVNQHTRAQRARLHVQEWVDDVRCSGDPNNLRNRYTPCIDGGMTHAGGWQPETNDVAIEFIWVDLEVPQAVCGVVTKGRNSATLNDWVTSYKVGYSDNVYPDPLVHEWTMVQENGADKVFQGNTDRDTSVTNMFEALRFTARYVEIVPVEFNNNISLRFDLIAC